MTEEEKQELIDVTFELEFVKDAIQDRYQRYKTDDKYFYVPGSIHFLGNGSAKIDIGDKSFKTRDELQIAVKAWSEGKIANIEPFIEIVWNNREKNINVLMLIETDEYCFGSVAVVSPKTIYDIIYV